MLSVVVGQDVKGSEVISSLETMIFLFSFNKAVKYVCSD